MQFNKLKPLNQHDGCLYILSSLFSPGSNGIKRPPMIPILSLSVFFFINIRIFPLSVRRMDSRTTFLNRFFFSISFSMIRKMAIEKWKGTKSTTIAAHGRTYVFHRFNFTSQIYDNHNKMTTIFIITLLIYRPWFVYVAAWWSHDCTHRQNTWENCDFI